MLPKTTDDGGGNSGADHGPRRPRQSSTVRTVSLGVVAVVASVLSSPPASNIPHLPDELQRTVEDDTCSTALQNLSPSLAPLLARHSFSILSILHNLDNQMYGYLVTRVSQRNNLFFGSPQHPRIQRLTKLHLRHNGGATTARIIVIATRKQTNHPIPGSKTHHQ